MNKRIKNLIFDMGGVLIDLDRAACVEAFREIGVPDADRMLDAYAPRGVFGELERGNISPEQFYSEIRGMAAGEITRQQTEQAFLKFLKGIPDYKLLMLLDLRKRFKVYMLSNTNPVMMPYIRENFFTRHGLSFGDYFDRAFLSFEMNAMKPDADIFIRMIGDTGMIPAESLFIDDGVSNVETARELGFETYLASAGEDFRNIFDTLQPAAGRPGDTV